MEVYCPNCGELVELDEDNECPECGVIIDVSKIIAPGTVFQDDDDVLREIFKEIKEPFITHEFLVENGVDDEEDLEFFDKLIEIRDMVSKDPFNCEESILTIYYKLLDICGYLNKDVVNDDANQGIINNIALITKTIDNYENIVSKNDFSSFYWFLSSNLKNYKTPAHEDEGVQIMTVHEAKGLEYPITILANTKEGRSPWRFRDGSKKHYNLNPYYTPNRFFEFKTKEDEMETKHYEEEVRVLYVAMTRAEETLIISTVSNEFNKVVTEMPEMIEKLIDNNPGLIHELIDFNQIEKVKEHKKPPEDTKLQLSYSSIDRYNACPFSYHLKRDFGFALESGDAINYGNIVHNSLDKLNQLSKEGATVTKKDVILLVAEIHDEIAGDGFDAFEKQHVIDNVVNYWEKFWDKSTVLESEYEFTIFENDYILAGAIDLIYQTKDGNLGIVDYKNAYNIDKYKLNKYYNQIYTYISALKEDPKYSDMEVTEAYIYGTYHQDEYPVDLDELKMNIQKDKVSDTSNAIKNQEFEPNQDVSCEWCDFNFICLTKRCPICGKLIADDAELCNDCRKNNN